MSGKRIQLDLFIPQTVFDTISDTKKKAFVAAVRAIKAYAVTLNEGQPNKEATTRAVWHDCYHDQPMPHPECGPDQEI